jgi:hypothetical protein
MKMQKLLAAAAMVFLTSAGAASAASITVDGSYTVSYTSTHGSTPTITDDLGNSGSFSESLTQGTTYTTPTNFLEVAPAGSSGLCSTCTATGTINVTFSFTEPSGIIGTATASANYSATYNPNHNLESDFVDWTSSPLVVDFTDGAVLHIDLANASDWNMYPQISFDLTQDPTATPLPAALPLFAGGLGILGFAGSWRRRRAAKATAGI